MKRRTLLIAGVQTALAGIILRGAAFAEYPTQVFLARETPEALREILDSADIGEFDKIEIEAPHIASDAYIVPVRVRSGFANTESISLVVAGNESPFTAHVRLYESQNFVSTRIRMADTSGLLVVVKAGGQMTVKSVINHSMESGNRKIKKTGEKVPPHFIHDVIVSRNRRIGCLITS